MNVSQTPPLSRPISEHQGSKAGIIAPSAPTELPDDEAERRMPSGWWLIPFSVLGAGIWYLIYQMIRSLFP
jgi:hypothetical protein